MKCLYLWQVTIVLLLLCCQPSSQAKPASCSETPAMAGMPQDGAACMAFMPTYSYNSAKNACERFIFGGCGGNDNQFASREDCEKSCKD